MNRIARGAWATFVLGAVLWTGQAVAHPGGLNAEGCHNDRKNGGYHCHRPQASKAPPTQAFSGGRAFAYRNCSEARAAGAAPIRRGEPGYGEHLDRDGDGIACEPYRGR